MGSETPVGVQRTRNDRDLRFAIPITPTSAVASKTSDADSGVVTGGASVSSVTL